MELRNQASRKRHCETMTNGTFPAQADERVSRKKFASESSAALGSARNTEEPPSGRSSAKFIVGLDYGTTYSSISYIRYDQENSKTTALREHIKSVSDWPNPGQSARCPEVPSESWYMDGEYFWGYNARQKKLGIMNTGLQSTNKLIQFPKLLLSDEQGEKSGPQEELRETLIEALKGETEVIQDYIREIFKHSKTYLMQTEGFHEKSEMEVAFCIPAGWSWKAQRTMQTILLEVMEEIKFGNFSAPYILNEPEAAAAYILEGNTEISKPKKDSLFMVCDAGGGTVDAITYRVRQDQPFRVDEVLMPAGQNCGSSYINKALKHEVARRLKGERYLLSDGTSLEYILEHDVMTAFENEIKRKFNTADGLDGKESIVIRGLRRNTNKDFGDRILYIPRRQIAGYFSHSLNGTCELIQKQLNAANERGLTVESILLVGGFSRSPTLRSHIQKSFPRLKLIPAIADMATVVSHGVVFRALNKTDGPRRCIRSNFAFLQIEEYNKKWRGHTAGHAFQNPLNNKAYINNVLDWVIKKNRILPMKALFRRQNYQTFTLDEKLEIRQCIYISDEDRVHNHYERTHSMNEGADRYGLLIANLENLKDDGLIIPQMGKNGEFYEIHYELVMQVDGRNMTVQLLYPPGGECRGQVRFCIAAAFKPGTE
ncbi:hypothetical protein BBP40_003030 [Aspergillus hancockii]|nr:hypothetical protein BBP40_003030 [Aspergillus hancockii]